ncbi:hypothetical protein [Roseovarius atlanticus]|uniref:hypothetical protein n=1 Tax=Roseovarius atlanticus TaxID=1641875 RepID=UPI001C94507E|nr:hypothetical protein [Roseovarius atlanticus]MBY5988213.1 hypothetical protein [Roseovarius atlanticus]MBY6123604.1 hypothetical protein [Roseovarius atlanticus]MBY6148099.1 hypothetical protein [Roseovarius atlanticus]
MPVVEGKSDLIHDPRAGDTPPDPQRARGELISMVGAVSNLGTDSDTSMYHLADIPSDAIVHPDTVFDVENWGFAQVVIGTETDTDALLDVAKSAATTQSPFAFGDANHGKAWWEALGLASDPGGFISLYAHAEANATGAGSMPFCIAYLTSH